MYKYFCLFLILSWFPSTAQVGVKVVNAWPKNRIAEATSNTKLFPTLVGAGIDYWFRLKKYRLEFLPAIHALYAHESVSINNEKVGKLNWTVIELAPVFQFYPFDFNNDCMCPTFSKQGQFFKKGFFVNLTPGLAHSTLSNSAVAVTTSQNVYFGRLGLGIDLGISDLLTLSPSMNYQFSQSLDWSKIFTSTGSDNIDLYTGLFLSARLGWRFDRKNY
ncbi:MAG: hypothetical protein ABI761_00210 [Saprospiraceae bacterium]